MILIITSMITGAIIAAVFFYVGRKSVKQQNVIVQKEDNVIKIDKALRNEKGFLSYKKYSS